jgi:WD40 repeat protein
MLLYPPGVVHSIDGKVTAGRNTRLAFISGQNGVPVIACWHAGQLQAVHKEAWQHVSDTSGAVLCASVIWLSVGPFGAPETDTVVSSTAAGLLNMWTTDQSGPAILVESLDNGHTRQVFALLPVTGARANIQGLVSVSMDRKICLWNISCLHEEVREPRTSRFCPVWGSFGYGGHLLCVTARDVSPLDQSIRDLVSTQGCDSLCEVADSASGKVIATSTADGYIHLEYSPDSETLTHEGLRTVCRYRLPHAGKERVNTAPVLCFSDIGRADGTQCSFLLMGTTCGQVGCIMLPSSADCADIKTEMCIGDAVSPRVRVERKHGIDILHISCAGDNSFLSVNSAGVCLIWDVVLYRSGGKTCCRLVRRADCKLNTHAFDAHYRCATSVYMPLKEAPERSDLLSRNLTLGGYIGIAVGTSRGEILISAIGLKPFAKAFDAERSTMSLKVESCSINCLAYSDKENVLAVGSANGVVRVFSLDWPKYFDQDRGVQCNIGELRWASATAHPRGVLSLSWQDWRSENSQDDSSTRSDLMLKNPPTSGQVLVTAGGDGLCRILNGLKGTDLALMRGHVGRVLSSVFKSRYIVLTAGEDCSLREWDIRKQPQITANKPPNARVLG